MAKEHELGIVFTSEGADKVESQIEDIADAAEKLDGEIEVDVTADTREAETRIQRFEREVDGLTDDARELRVEFRSQQINKEIKKTLRELEKLDDPVDIEAKTGDLERAQQDLKDLAELAERKYEIEIDADPKRTAKRAAGDMEGLNETSQRGIGVLRGVTDELGETAQAGGVAGAAFVDAGEAVEIFGAKAGLSPEILGKVGGALGGLGLAVTAGSVAWGLFNKAQKEAEERAKSLLEVQEDLSEQKYADAAEKLADTYDGLFEKAADEGLNYTQTLAYITGASDDLGSSLNDVWAGSTGFDQQRFLQIVKPLQDARDAFADQGDELTRNNRLVNQLETGLRITFGDKGPLGELSGGTEAFNDFSDSVYDFSVAADEASSEIEDLSQEFEDLVDGLEGNVNELKFDKKIDKLFQNVVDAAKKADDEIAAKGFDGAEESIRDAEIAIGDLRLEVGRYVSELDKIKPEVRTDIITDLDTASAQEVLRLYDQLRAGVVVPVSIQRLDDISWWEGTKIPLMAPDDSNTRGMALDSPVVAASSSPYRTRGIGVASVQNVTINVPNGLNLRNVNDTLSRWQRINGGRL
jgi:hypothetical protein